jgi:aminopeptidase-like protein
MQVLDLYIPGESNEEVLINAHNCHPFQANDDISGCATGIAFFASYLKLRKYYYSYRLLIGPELFGPMFWLDSEPELSRRIKACILLKSVGNESSLKIQNSFNGASEVDKVARVAAEKVVDKNVEFHPFRTYYGNDETVFEAPGLEIPSITLTRFPFLEYHTDFDLPALLSPKRLGETYDMLCAIVDVIESNQVASHVMPGLHCLSNPMYDLYRKAPEPGISYDGMSELEIRWNLLMNCLPRDLGAGLSMLDISLKYKLSYELVRDYVNEWERKGLASLKRAVL